MNLVNQRGGCQAYKFNRATKVFRRFQLTEPISIKEHATHKKAMTGLPTHYKLNLIVRITEPLRMTDSGNTPPLFMLTCERCHNSKEVVVATMRILPFDKSWALCGACLSEMPKGYQLV
jgi:hypothetical protein